MKFAVWGTLYCDSYYLFQKQTAIRTERLVKVDHLFRQLRAAQTKAAAEKERREQEALSTTSALTCTLKKKEKDKRIVYTKNKILFQGFPDFFFVSKILFKIIYYFYFDQLELKNAKTFNKKQKVVDAMLTHKK